MSVSFPKQRLLEGSSICFLTTGKAIVASKVGGSRSATSPLSQSGGQAGRQSVVSQSVSQSPLLLRPCLSDGLAPQEDRALGFAFFALLVLVRVV